MSIKLLSPLSMVSITNMNSSDINVINNYWNQAYYSDPTYMEKLSYSSDSQIRVSYGVHSLTGTQTVRMSNTYSYSYEGTFAPSYEVYADGVLVHTGIMSYTGFEMAFSVMDYTATFNADLYELKGKNIEIKYIMRIKEVAGNYFYGTDLLYGVALEANVVDTVVNPDTPSNPLPSDGETLSGSRALFQATLIDNDDPSINDELVLVVEYAPDSSFSSGVTIVTSPKVLSGNVASVYSAVLPDGTYYWRAKARDKGNLESGYTNVRTFVIFNNAPNIPTNLLPNDNVTSGNLSATFSGTVSDKDGGLLKLSVEYSTASDFSTKNTIASSDISSGQVASVDSPTLVNGTVYYWRARTYDGLKYSDYSEARILKISNQVPRLSSLVPANNTVVTASSVTFSAVVTDAEASNSVVHLEISKQKNFSVLSHNLTNSGVVSGTTTSFNVSGLLQGNYYWRMKVKDGITNEYSTYTIERALFVNVPSTGRFAPEAILVMSGATGDISMVQDDPDSPDANWMGSGVVDSIVRTSLPTPAKILKAGAGLQNFRVLVRKNQSTTTTGTLHIALYENGVQKATASYSIATGNTPTVHQFSWDASLLADRSGKDAEIYVRGVGVYSGGGASRFGVQYGAMEWNYESESEIQDGLSLTDNTPPSEVSNLSESKTSKSMTLSWINPSDYDFSHVTILRNGVQVATNITGTYYVDSNLTANTQYTYLVKTVDKTGNQSAGLSITSSTKTEQVIGENDPPPSVTIISISRNKLSDEPSMNVSTVSFRFNMAVSAWTVNVNGSSWDSGRVADSGGTVSAETAITAQIDWTELYQEGQNRINIYGKNTSGIWTLHAG